MANRAGFLLFIRNSMGIGSSVLPDNSSDIDSALALALELVYSGMQDASKAIYDLAVYNLAGSNLIEFANDISASFSGYVVGLNLTITSTITGTVGIGQSLSGVGIDPETLIAGGSGTAWTVSVNQTVGSVGAPIAMQSASTYFSDLRAKFNINGFTPGLIASTSDESTSESLLNPDFMKGLQLADLQYLKNPWGRAYLGYAQRIGPVWGIS